MLHHRSLTAWLTCCALAFLCSYSSVFGDDWITRVTIADREAYAEIAVRLLPETGLPLRIEDEEGNHLTFRLGVDRPGVSGYPSGRFADTFFARADFLLFDPVDAARDGLLVLRRRARHWWLFIDDTPVAGLPEAFAGSVKLSHPRAHLPAPESVDPFVQRLANVLVRDDFMIPPDAEQPLGMWAPVQGEWSVHNVERDDTTERRRRDRRGPTAGRSPNFYSMQGRGERALIAIGTEFDEHYTLRAGVQHNSGTNGIAFFVSEDGALHAFTAETDDATGRLRFVLWRGSLDSPERTPLAAAQTELLSGQWHLLEVQLFDDRIVARVNHIELLRHAAALPPGGRFGLFADGAEGARFDDVWATSHADLPLRDAWDLARFTDVVAGDFRIVDEPLAGLTGTATRPGAPQHLEVRRGNPASLRFGSATDGPRRIATAVRMPAPTDAPTGLALGHGTDEQPEWRLVMHADAEGLNFRLETRTQEGTQVRRSVRLPAPSANDAPLRLALDATRADMLRGYFNERLVVMAVPEKPVEGPAAVFAPRGARLSLPETVTHPFEFVDRTEQNQQYVNDPFMRHWASPEGQWVPMPDDMIWYRGDAFGRVSVELPVVGDSTLHLAVPQDQTEGAVRLGVRSDNLTLWARTNAEPATIVAEWPVAELPDFERGDLGGVPVVTLHLEDHVVWLTADGRPLWQGFLPERPSGTRLRIEGFKTEELRHVHVQRDRVLDVLFHEALQAWTINGGRWEVVNRFQCEPTWTHMNGQNDDGLAALWSKYAFSGDFSAELFAGMRHGDAWYQRAGDMNLTIMNRRDTPGDGYTVVTTGWDPDLSQETSRLFRNGSVLATATDYLVPRHREGSRRRGHEPLLAEGRDIHGAWYGFKLRRIADRLLFSFDNVPVFDVNDPAPIESGGFGIWTYRNSIVVARVRVAAEDIRPRPFTFTTLAPDSLLRARSAAAEESEHDPRAAMSSAAWSVADCAANAVLEWRRIDDVPAFVLRARQAGGELHALAELPALSTRQLSGWRFEIARAPETAVNAGLVFGDRGADGAFVPREACSFTLSGTDLERGPRRMIGRRDLPATSRDDFPMSAQWTPVTVWLPLDLVDRYPLVQFEGFGNLQPGDIQQGLGANPPGAAYAVRRLEPLWYGAAPADAPLEGAATPAPEADDWRFVLSDRGNHAFELRSETAAPPRSPDDARLYINDAAVELKPLDDAWLALPGHGYAESDDGSLTWRMEVGESVVARGRATPEEYAEASPPTLIELELPGGFETFELSNPGDLDRFRGERQPSLVGGPVPQGARLRIENEGHSARLRTMLGSGVDLVANPLPHFRYRADPLARVSLEIQGLAAIPFAEPPTRAAQPYPVALDGEWHDFHTFAGDWLGEYPIDRARQLTAAGVRMLSNDRVDQTGRYAWIELDALGFGPAVGTERPLRFRARYRDLNGVDRVAYRLVPEGEEAPVWRDIDHNEFVTADLDGLPDGRYRLELRAWNRRDAVSSITRVPVLLDSTGDDLSTAFSATPEQGEGSRLELSIASAGGSPVRLDALSLTCDGEAVSLDPEHVGVRYESDGDTLVRMDWPWLLSRHLNRSEDGQTFVLRIDGLSDGADNPIAPVEASIVMDYAADRLPPTMTGLRTDDAAFAWIGVLGPFGDGFGRRQHVRVTPLSAPDDSMGVEIASARRDALAANAFGGRGWDPEQHPFLALSLAIPRERDAETVVLELEFTSRNDAFVVDGGRSNTLRIPLSGDHQPLTEHALGVIDWTPERWNDLLIDARALLRQHAASDNAPSIRDLAIVITGRSGTRVWARTVAILEPWQRPHRLALDARDASGLMGLRWQFGTLNMLAMRPVGLDLPADDPFWLRVQVVDRAGNAAPALHIPVPPTDTDAPPLDEQDLL